MYESYWIVSYPEEKQIDYCNSHKNQDSEVLSVHRWEESSPGPPPASSIGTWPAFATVAEVDLGSAWAKASMSDAETIPSPSPATARNRRKTWENLMGKIRLKKHGTSQKKTYKNCFIQKEICTHHRTTKSGPRISKTRSLLHAAISASVAFRTCL